MNGRIALLAADPSVPEKPWQRLAVLLFANGTPIHDIATELGKKVEEITEFITSEKGSHVLKTVIGDNEQRLLDLIEAAAIDSILALIKVRDTSPSPQARVSAACQLLDRATPKIKSQDAKARRQRQANDFDKVKGEIKSLRDELATSIQAP